MVTAYMVHVFGIIQRARRHTTQYRNELAVRMAQVTFVEMAVHCSMSVAYHYSVSLICRSHTLAVY